MVYHILAVGDVVMEPGLRCLERHLRPVQKLKGIDFTVVNGENAAGVGLTREQAERMRQDIYPKIADALRGRTLTEARKLARDLFYEAAKSHPENAPTIQHAFVPFRDAVPWEDLVGMSLTATSAEQEIVVDGKTHLIRPVSYMSPKLGCQRKENGQWVARTLMLNAMEPEEMWTILRSKPESTLSRKELYSRALLMFRVAPGDEFKSFVRRHKINELRPLFEYVN